MTDEIKGTGAESQETDTAQEEHLFTQSELNAKIASRLSKYADYDELKAKAEKYDEMEEASKTELQKSQEKAAELQKKLDALTQANAIRDIRDKVAKETGVPSALLSGDDENTCRVQAKGILDFKKSDTYPQVRNAGEVKPGKKDPAVAFSEWITQNLNNH